MEDNKGLSREQFRAIKQSIKLGRTLQKDHPEIADIYGYYFQADIPEMLDIQSKYGVSDNVALTGVYFAINGHEEGFGIEDYVGLITDEEELKRLREGRMVAGRQKGGQTTYEQRIGIYALTLDEKRELGRRGGQKGGQKGGRKSAIARGQTPWTDEEREFSYMLSQEQEYQHPKGSNNPGKPNNELIAFALNIEYHDCNEVRSTQAVNVQLSNYRKSLDDVVA